MNQHNWFETLNSSLESENLIDLWPIGSNINYNQTVQHIVADDQFYRLISVYRDNNGRYERPISYITGKI
jgi:hypothetical protein